MMLFMQVREDSREDPFIFSKDPCEDPCHISKKTKDSREDPHQVSEDHYFF